MVQEIEMTKEEQIEMYMKSSKKELCEMLIEANRHLKNLLIHGVRHPLPTKQEAEIELSTMLAEIEKNTKESYLKRTILKGIEIGFKKGYNYMKGNCA